MWKREGAQFSMNQPRREVLTFPTDLMYFIYPSNKGNARCRWRGWRRRYGDISVMCLSGTERNMWGLYKSPYQSLGSIRYMSITPKKKCEVSPLFGFFMLVFIKT